MSRPAEIDAFLAAAGWDDAERRPLAGDASARRYLLLVRGRSRAVLMDAPPETGLSVAPFLAVADWLRGLGLSAPETYAADIDLGLILSEDLGDSLLARLAADPAREAETYAAAVDLLAGLPSAPPPPAHGWSPPPYDAAVLVREMRLAVEWYIPAATGAPASPDLAAEFDALTAPLVAMALEGPQVPVLRDFHAENLIWLPERRDDARIGLLDFQDLLIGHPAYDLVSLLNDARRDVPEALRRALTARFHAATGRDPDAFAAAMAALSAQRNLKILGLFVRLARRDGKPGYLRHLPRVRGLLARDLAHPALAPLDVWAARRLPPAEALLAAPQPAAAAAP